MSKRIQLITCLIQFRQEREREKILINYCHKANLFEKRYGKENVNNKITSYTAVSVEMQKNMYERSTK